MRGVSAAAAVVLVLLASAGTARAGPGLLIGVHDDQIKWTSGGKPVLPSLRALGVDAMRVTLAWRPGRRGLTGKDHHELWRAVAASRLGLRVVLAVYGRADDAPQTERAREGYCRFVRNVLGRYTEIRDVVVWNEANSPGFWRPQESAPEKYAALLGRCWDLLHRALPDVNVVTTTAAAHDPVAFLRRVAAAYRAAGRARPLFDTVGHNPYPLFPDEAPDAAHEVYVGQGDYERFVGAIDEAFAGTAQPAPPIWYLEDGFQTAVGETRRALYDGRESVTGTLSPAAQAGQLVAALRLARCQPRVGAFFNFLLVDEPSLERWQSGLLWADWRRKPAFKAYREAIREVRGDADSCPDTPSPTVDDARKRGQVIASRSGVRPGSPSARRPR